MTPEEQEERLAEIRARVESDKDKNWAPQFRSSPHLEEDRAWLLELVDTLQEEMNCVLDYNLANQELVLEKERLQEQVRELRAEISDLRLSLQPLKDDNRRLQEQVAEYEALENKLTNEYDELFVEKERLQEQVRELESRCTHVDLCPHCGV